MHGQFKSILLVIFVFYFYGSIPSLDSSLAQAVAVPRQMHLYFYAGMCGPTIT